MRKEEGGRRKLGLKRSNGREILHESQILEGGEEKIFRKIYKISETEAQPTLAHSQMGKVKAQGVNPRHVVPS